MSVHLQSELERLKRANIAEDVIYMTEGRIARHNRAPDTARDGSLSYPSI